MQFLTGQNNVMIQKECGVSNDNHMLHIPWKYAHVLVYISPRISGFVLFRADLLALGKYSR